jgi:RNA polymerase sigma-70 factor (ECF subfamily)
MTDRLKELTLVFLAERHALLAFIHGLVRDRDAAEEILQEIWLRLVAAVERGVEVDSPRSWFRGVAKNLILHHFRSQRRAKVVADSSLVEAMVEAAALAFEEGTGDPLAERSRRLMDCLDRLPARSRNLLQLKYEAGLRVAQIAERLARSEDAIMKALSRVRQILGDCVERGSAITESDL